MATQHTGWSILQESMDMSNITSSGSYRVPLPDRKRANTALVCVQRGEFDCPNFDAQSEINHVDDSMLSETPSQLVLMQCEMETEQALVLAAEESLKAARAKAGLAKSKLRVELLKVQSTAASSTTPTTTIPLCDKPPPTDEAHASICESVSPEADEMMAAIEAEFDKGVLYMEVASSENQVAVLTTELTEAGRAFGMQQNAVIAHHEHMTAELNLASTRTVEVEMFAEQEVMSRTNLANQAILMEHHAQSEHAAIIGRTVVLANEQHSEIVSRLKEEHAAEQTALRHRAHQEMQHEAQRIRDELLSAEVGLHANAQAVLTTQSLNVHDYVTHAESTAVKAAEETMRRQHQQEVNIQKK